MQKALHSAEATFLVQYDRGTIRKKVATVGVRLFVFLRYIVVPVIIFIREYPRVICNMTIRHLPTGNVSSMSIIERFSPVLLVYFRKNGRRNPEIRCNMVEKRMGPLWTN